LQEGGYNPNNSMLASVVLHALAGKELKVEENFDSLSSAVTAKEKTRKIVEERIEALRLLLRDYFTL